MIINKRKNLEESYAKDSQVKIYQDIKGITMYEEPPQNIISLSDF